MNRVIVPCSKAKHGKFAEGWRCNRIVTAFSSPCNIASWERRRLAVGHRDAKPFDAATTARRRRPQKIFTDMVNQIDVAVVLKM